MRETEIILTDEQVINGIDINHIFWEMMNGYGMAYRMVGSRNIVHVYFPDDTTDLRISKVRQFIEGLVEKYADMNFDEERSILIETINCYDRKAAIVQVIVDNDLDLNIRYFPTATGHLEDGTYINKQRWFFSRVLTEEERSLMEEAIKTPLTWRTSEPAASISHV